MKDRSEVNCGRKISCVLQEVAIPEDGIKQSLWLRNKLRGRSCERVNISDVYNHVSGLFVGVLKYVRKKRNEIGNRGKLNRTKRRRGSKSNSKEVSVNRERLVC